MLTAFDVVTGFGESATGLKFTSAICDDLCSEVEQFWTQIESGRVSEIQASEHYSSVVERWGRATQKINLSLHVKGGGNMAGDDFAVSVGWGHFGTGEAVMPGHGRIVERDYTDEERTALADAIPTLGNTTFDVYLNDRAYWRNAPATVWHYQLGGYQVLKKWLSYRESKVLSRPLRSEEVQHFTNTARRIAAIIQMV